LVVAERWPHISLPHVDEAVGEVTACGSSGVGTMLDAMPTGSGRHLSKLAEVSRRTGVHVIASTGMHTEKYYVGVDWVDDPPEELALRFISEIVDGVDGVRVGVMKVAALGPIPTRRESALFLSAGLVHISTGVPILTHCEEGMGALGQVEMLVRAGVEPGRIIISHTDKVTDRSYHRDILGTGANVEYDQALRQHLIGSTDTASLISDMWEAGFGSQIMLGTDGARRSLWSTLGGKPGLAWLFDGFDSVLRDKGLGGPEIEAMFVTNPARVLSLGPSG